MFNQKLNKTIKSNTYTNTSPKTSAQKRYRKNTMLTLLTLMFVLVLVSSVVYTTTFKGDSQFASAYTVNSSVSNELDLRTAVATSGTVATQYVIALTDNIELTSSTLTIPANANVVLISENVGPWKLIGPNGESTITVTSGSELVLDGIVVTHKSGDIGRGVYVESDAKLTLNSGEISENNIDYEPHSDDTDGGGVYNWGKFIMNGGTIQKNSAYNGGGVYNIVAFEMKDGTLSENTASGAGGGVSNLGIFVMEEGIFSKNKAEDGGGVLNGVKGTFTLITGTFIENKAGSYGGGVYNDGPDGTFTTLFTMRDGTFSKNQAGAGGGVYNLGTFEMYGGIIGSTTVTDGNIADDSGGGVFDDGYNSVFNMYNGKISNNVAHFGGGVDGDAGEFNMLDGTISDNTATYGGGVLVWNSIFNMKGGVISDNTATKDGGGVYNWKSVFSMFDDAVISDNKADNYGGGVYNDVAATFNLKGGVISGNTAAEGGGGVYNVDIFNMLGGVISGNTVSGTSHSNRGGGVYNIGYDAIFNMVGGIIGGSYSESNSAYDGGGVYNEDQGTFTMSGNATVLGNRATFGGGVYNDDSKFVLGDPTYPEIVRISGNTASSNGGGVYNAGKTALFNMYSNTIISDNTAGIDGGGVFNVNAGVFNMYGGQILTNSAGTGGGGVDTSGEFTMYSGRIAYNTALGAAGVLNYRHFNMIDGEITDNTSTGYAGGVENNGSSALGLATFNMQGNAIIANNTADYGGGGVYNAYNAIFNMRNNALITNNKALSSSISAGRGGGVHNSDNATLNMYDNTIISNNLALYGGGVFNDFNTTTNMANDSAVKDNTVSFYGGAVYNWNPYTTAPSLISMTDRATISGNTANWYGGGIQNTNSSIIRISGQAVIANNSAPYGGGIFTISTLPNAVTINGGTIANNTASLGAGIYTNSQLTMTNGIIANNTATVDGAGIYIAPAGFVELRTGLVYSNIADNNGGGIWIAYANLNHLFVYDGMVFANNRASMAYNRNPIDDALYHSQIGINVIWTVPFKQGYTNYDISYINGTPLTNCTIIYDPGTQGTWQAIDETYTSLAFGASTPVFGTNSGADTAVDHTGGYRFTGWQPTWSPIVSGNITYVAQWATTTEPVFYTITYNGNGYTSGTVPMGGSYPSGHSVLIAAQGNMVREGFVFQGWAYTSDAKTPDFAAGSTAYLILTKDATLFAVWLKEGTSLMYTVTYLPGEYGTFDAVSYVCALGDLTPEAPVVTGQSGWSFIGWSPNPTPTVEGDATYVAQWEQNNPTPSPTATPTPTSTPTPTTRPPTSTPTPTPIPTSSPSPSPTTSPPGGNVDEKPIWALVNLILSIVGVILAVVLTLYVLLQRNQKHKKQQAQDQKKDTKGQYSSNQKQKNTNTDNDDDHTEGKKKQKQRRLFWFLLSVIMGIVGIVVFLLTEDMSRPMALVDNWTIVNVIIFIVELIAIVLTFKHTDNKAESVTYTVQYYLQGTKNPIAASKTSGFGSVGVSVTEYAPAISGYMVTGKKEISLTLKENPTNNEIIFYYTRNTDEDKTKQQTRSGN